MGERCVITGATGFVGTSLAERLLARGSEVHALVRSTSSARSVEWLRGRGVVLHRGDVFDEAALLSAFEGADVVFHCAAVIGYRRRLEGEMYRTNVLGTRRVVHACLRAGVGRLVHMSSIAAVGLAREPVLLDENSAWNAGVLRAAYFDTKHAAEREVDVGLEAGLDAVLVNPGAIYGPSAVPSNSSRLIEMVARRPPRLLPQGGINAVTLGTVVEGTLAAADRGRRGRRYILGGENLTYLHLMRKIGEAAGRTVDAFTLPDALGPVARVAMQLVEPCVPDRVWYTPDLCAAFGWWMWFDCARARGELGLVSEPLQPALVGAVEQLRSEGRLGARVRS